MKMTAHDLERRRPLWEALSQLFLDTENQEADYRWIARCIRESGYTLSEVECVLWEEVFPVVEWNLRHPCGVWQGFRLEWLEQAILGNQGKQFASQQPSTARFIREDWAKVCQFLLD